MSGTRRAAVAAGTGGIIVGLIVGAVGMRLADQRTSSAGATTSKKKTELVAVQRRTLEVTESTTGELASSDEHDLPTIASGTLTSPVTVGATVGRGDIVARIDDTPVVLLLGDRPAWRSFQSGMTPGLDIAELEMNLAALGYAPSSMTVDDTYDAATATAITRWENALGVTSPDGTAPAGEVVFSPTPVQVTAAAAVGTRISPGTTLAKVRPDDGSGLQLTFTVTEDADRYQPGRPVGIVTADGTSHPATITSIVRAAQTNSGGGFDGGGASSASFTVTAAPAAATGLAAGPVDVQIPTQSADDALAVPSRALVAVVEGGQAVELANHQLVAVTVGVFADGWVQVSGKNIVEGTKVVVPE